jgi:phenylalanyl-tRNA synthetase alpha chain
MGVLRDWLVLTRHVTHSGKAKALPLGIVSVDSVNQILEQALADISATEELSVLDDLRVQYLGKKGEITALLKSLGGMEHEQRKAFGQAVNIAKGEVAKAVGSRKQVLEDIALNARLASETIDVTLPGRGQQRGGLHPVTHTLQRMTDIFSRLGYDIATGPEVEDDYHNFESLNFPPHHPARAMHDTFYFADGRMLRTHTSPVQIREMMKKGAPIRIIAPGKVYRSDSD